MARRLVKQHEPADVEVSSDEGSTGADEAYRPPWGPVGIVLAVELCERLTYYTLAGSQKTYLNKRLGYSASSAAAVNSIFSMLCYMWCLPGGLAADVIGRYKVIVSLASTYALGTLMVAIATTASMQQHLKSLFLFGALGLIPFGTGGIKPNICNFGADQIGDETESQREAQKKFFSYFYMAINVGVMVAFGYLANVTTHGIPGHVPLEQGYFAAYIVAAVSMAVAVGLFVAGTKCYTLLPGGGIQGFTTMVSFARMRGDSVMGMSTSGGWEHGPALLNTDDRRGSQGWSTAAARSSCIWRRARARRRVCARAARRRARAARRRRACKRAARAHGCASRACARGSRALGRAHGRVGARMCARRACARTGGRAKRARGAGGRRARAPAHRFRTVKTGMPLVTNKCIRRV